MNSKHVGDRMLDFLEGRLEPATEQQVEAHLASCMECAADFSWAREFRDTATTTGLRHLDPVRILALAEQSGPPRTRVEQGHLETCASCQRELDWVCGLSDAGTAEQTSGATRKEARRLRKRYDAG